MRGRQSHDPPDEAEAAADAALDAAEAAEAAAAELPYIHTKDTLVRLVFSAGSFERRSDVREYQLDTYM
jgi:hypothetical protein